jgi:dTDP-4-dehydrorhamnose reductase
MFLIVGGNSEIGSATAKLVRARGATAITTTRRPDADFGEVHLDLASPVDDFTVPAGVRCACIFVAIARLAACEADPAGSHRINVTQTVALADRLTDMGIYTLFLSTNQVFGGNRPKVPADASFAPASEYGRQKAEAERLLRARMANGAPIGILRFAKVVSPGMTLIANWNKELAAGRSIRAFHDMAMAPTPVDLAAAVIARMMEDRSSVIAQMTGPRDVTYLEVGRFLAREMGVDPRAVEPVGALESGMPPGATPRNTTLDSSYVAESYGITVPDAFDVIKAL